MNVAIKEFFLRGSCQRDSSTSSVSVPVTDNKDLVSKCQKKFKSEARKIASLNNDHIVNIIDIFDENGTSYYVMKYLSGGSLADKIKDGPLPEKEALRIVDEVSDALGSIHSHGLLHLDIKPANILFDERDRAVLIDFGVSKYLDNPEDSTTTSTLIGFSRGFAPLEQMNSMVSSLSPATDIYSLGATLYNLVVGATPPDASIVMETGLPAFPSGISDEVKHTIKQSMQPRRKDRPQSIDSFLEMLPGNVPSEDIDVTLVAEQLDATRELEQKIQELEQKNKAEQERSNKLDALLKEANQQTSLAKQEAAEERQKKAEVEKAAEDDRKDLKEEIARLNNAMTILTKENSDLAELSNKKVESEQKQRQKLESLLEEEKRQKVIAEQKADEERRIRTELEKTEKAARKEIERLKDQNSQLGKDISSLNDKLAFLNKKLREYKDRASNKLDENTIVAVASNNSDEEAITEIYTVNDKSEVSKIAGKLNWKLLGYIAGALLGILAILFCAKQCGGEKPEQTATEETTVTIDSTDTEGSTLEDPNPEEPKEPTPDPTEAKKAPDIPVTGLSLDKTDITLTVGEKVKLNAIVTPNNATNKACRWKSDNPAIASVSNSGVVTAKSEAITYVSATVNGITKECRVTVESAEVTQKKDADSAVEEAVAKGDWDAVYGFAINNNEKARVAWANHFYPIAKSNLNGGLDKQMISHNIAMKLNDLKFKDEARELVNSLDKYQFYSFSDVKKPSL